MMQYPAIINIYFDKWSFDQDYLGGEKNERRVGLILDKEKMKCVLGYWQLLKWVLVKMKGILFNTATCTCITKHAW